MSAHPVTEYSLMDMLFDRVESIKTEKEEEEEEESPIKIEETNDGYWDNNSDDFLDSILFNQDLDFMEPNDIFVEEPTFSEEVSGSVCSDSGVSSDQQFSPLSSHDTEDDQEFKSSLQNEIFVEPDISVDASVLNLLGDSDPKEDPLKEEKITIHKSGEESVKVPQARPQSVRCKGPISKILSGTNTKVLNLASLQSHNPRSILIPVSIKGRGNVKTLKIIKAARKSPPKCQVRIKTEPVDDAASTSDEMDLPDASYPRLQLTDEEKRLMVKEGISLPTHYPLTKQEERDLKRIRRKIRNKISAQDSRKRKKEYVDGLEDRVKQYSAENASLIKKVKALQSENQTLNAHLKKLQAVIAKGGSQQANSSTCLMVLILSLALIMAPNMRGPRSPPTPPDLSLDTPQQSSPITGRSRALLETQKPSEKGFLEPPLDGVVVEEEKEVGILNELAELLRFRSSSHNDHDYTPRKRARGLIEPPLDDHWPPPKRPNVQGGVKVGEERRNATRSHILTIKVAPDDADM